MKRSFFCSCFLFFTKFINDLEQNLCQEWGKGQRYLLWKYRFLVMIFRCGMSVQLPALFWLVYDWLNQIWPMKLERADSCESSHMSFLENQKVVPGESERSPRVYFLDPRMTTHNCACALKGLRVCGRSGCQTEFWPILVPRVPKRRFFMSVFH